MLLRRTCLIAVMFLAITAHARPLPQGSYSFASPPILHGPPQVAASLLAVERAFALRARQAGPAEAMKEFMDPVDGLSFTGGEPARGAEAIFQAHGGAKPGGALSWLPTEVFAAEGGDMGATWGHFRFTPPGGGKPVTGRYVTVWRKRDGQWKGILDIGNPD